MHKHERMRKLVFELEERRRVRPADCTLK